jgi:pimeloyl-ACP methyl ester carboxylesterase
MLQASESIRRFERAALVVWAADDKFFPREHGRRLAELLPKGRFALADGSRTFIPEDQPAHLVTVVGEFLAEQR